MSGETTLRAGVIGLGWAGEQHLNAYRDLPGVEIVAVADPGPFLAERGEELGIDEDRRFADPQALIDSGLIDVISIATPTATHAPLAIAALDAGLHVLSEKPMAETGVVAQTMVDAAQRNGRVLDVCFNHRRRGNVKALKKVIDEGVLGDIYYAKTGWVRRQGIPGMGGWFTTKSLAGGGPMMDIGVHMLDMTLYLLGEPQVTTATGSIYAEFGPKGRGGSAFGTRNVQGATAFDVEDLSTAMLRLDSGATLLVEASWAQWIPHDDAYVTVYGSEGGASIHFGGDGAALEVWTEKDGYPARLEPPVLPDGHHKEAVADFVAKVASGDFAAHDGSDAVVRALVVDAIYASAEKGGEVTL